MLVEQKRKPLAARGFAIAIVAMHLALSVAHGLAHQHLAIALTAAQKIFIGVVIVAAPILAAYFLWAKRVRLGAGLLAVSMAGALAFGVYYHFVAVGPDKVNQSDPAGPANWRNLLEDTAVDLALIEALGTLAGVVLLAKTVQHNPEKFGE